MQLDSAGKKLVAAAYLAEMVPKGPFGFSDIHPISALFSACFRRRTPLYQKAVDRLFSCAGMDMADFSKDEVIDVLVAAAYWEDE